MAKNGIVTSDNSHDGLLPAHWDELSALVDDVLDAPAPQRAALIAQLCHGDVARIALLAQMVEECERELPLLDRPAPEQFAQLLDDEPQLTLPELLGDRYRIEREIGRGGMARVFLADDTKHHRKVAVKVIRPDLAASLGRERFLREIGIAARLRHPNIVPLYDSGDADGVLYFVMPYEDGPSLRQRLATGAPLPAAEYVSVLRDMARALAYAHEQGVVHRDVKPDNVMLSGGAAVVTDFGIAKAVSAAQEGGSAATTLTQSGSGIGTPTYMAPEQAVGDPGTDHRADIYALGCVAYELITGKPPFHDLPVHQLVAAHVATAPTPIRDISPDASESIAALVMQCLAKEPADRPQSAKAVLDVLEAVSSAAHAAVPRAQETRAIEPVDPPARLRRVAPVLTTAGLLAVAVISWLTLRGGSPVIVEDVTVAVLPLQNSGGDSVQRALAEGLSDEVATELFRVPGVRVMSRRGVGNYRNQRELDTQKLGRELGARFLVMGTMREVDGRLRVLASLVRATDGAVLWTDRFDRAQRELSEVRTQIARAIGDTLARLVPRGAGMPSTVAGESRLATRAARTRAIDPEAYRLYVLAQRALDRRGLSIQASVDNFAKATLIDSTYAEAWAGLSLARALTPYFTTISAPTVEPGVRTAATRALALDSTLAPAHVALGLAHQHAYQWDSAATEFQTAVRLRAAGDVEPLIQYGRHLVFRGRVRQAMQQFLLARSTEPASALVSSWVSYAYYVNGQLDSALVENRRAYQSDSMNMTTLTHGALIRLSLGLNTEALKFARRIPPHNPLRLYVISALGDSAGAMSTVRGVESVVPRVSTVWSARAYVMLAAGDTSAAMAALERGADNHEMWPSYQAALDPVHRSLWQSTRYRALLRRVGLGDIVLPATAPRP